MRFRVAHPVRALWLPRPRDDCRGERLLYGHRHSEIRPCSAGGQPRKGTVCLATPRREKVCVVRHAHRLLVRERRLQPGRVRHVDSLRSYSLLQLGAQNAPLVSSHDVPRRLVLRKGASPHIAPQPCGGQGGLPPYSEETTAPTDVLSLAPAPRRSRVCQRGANTARSWRAQLRRPNGRETRARGERPPPQRTRRTQPQSDDGAGQPAACAFARLRTRPRSPSCASSTMARGETCLG